LPLISADNKEKTTRGRVSYNIYCKLKKKQEEELRGETGSLSLEWEKSEWGRPEEEGEGGRSREEVEDEDDETLLKLLQLHFIFFFF